MPAETVKQYLKEQLRNGADLYKLFYQAGYAFINASNFYKNWNEVHLFADGEMSFVDTGNRRFYIHCVEHSIVRSIAENVDNFVDTLCSINEDLITKIGHLGEKMYVRTPPTFMMDVIHGRKIAIWCSVGFLNANDPGIELVNIRPGESPYYDHDLDLPIIKIPDKALKEWEEIWG
jgi:hypothetical protein